LAGDCRITGIWARQILDSRGIPTVEAEVKTATSLGRASAPSGASKGANEAVELRDGNRSRFHGKGVSKAVANVNRILAPKLVGFDADDQRLVDRTMIRLDGTPNKGRLGANAILAVSMASARAAAQSRNVALFSELRRAKQYTLPVPMMNVLNGGEHAGNGLAVQEFLVEPIGARSCSEGIRMGDEVYQSLKAVLISKYGRGAINVGDEGGFAPPLRKTREALNAVREAVKEAGYDEKSVKMGIDAAASTFYDRRSNSYKLDGTLMKPERLEEFYVRLQDEYNLLTIEDPFHEDAAHSFSWLTGRIGRKAKIVGDDLYVTNVSRIRKGMETKATNAVLIKLNQIGTVTETEEAIELAQKARWSVAISHRSGETEDPFIAHLATAFGADFIKAGAPARGERVAKYNELLRIEEQLGSKGSYAGKRF
jgi:enolase